MKVKRQAVEFLIALRSNEHLYANLFSRLNLYRQLNLNNHRSVRNHLLIHLEFQIILKNVHLPKAASQKKNQILPNLKFINYESHLLSILHLHNHHLWIWMFYHFSFFIFLHFLSKMDFYSLSIVFDLRNSFYTFL